MGFCSCTVKFLMLVFNLFCAIAGLIILVVGIMMNSNGGSFKQLISGQVTNTSVAIMVLGGIVFLIAFFGCCGAMREDTCMIQTYGVILMVILIAEVAIGITAFVYKGKVKEALEENGRKMFENYDKNREAIDEVQKDLKCCGYKGPADYKGQIPNSCCPKKNCTQSEVYKDGCESKIIEEGKSVLNTIGAVAIGIGVVELLGVICAFYVASSIKSQMRRGYA